jgi:HEAT repeat protein
VDELKRLYGVSYHTERVPFPFEERSRAVVPVLIELLRDSNPVVRRYAAECLGDLGPEARPAVPALLRALQDQEVGGFFDTVGEAAEAALRKIDPQTAAESGVPRD